MATIYSVRFIADSSAGSPVSYTVPDGYVAVLRSVNTVLSSSGSFANLQISNLGVYVCFFAATAADEFFSWDGRQVLQEGDVLESYVSSAGSTQLVSGYLLSTTS